MSQFWHNLCCRNCDPEEGPCPECPGSRKVPVTWTGSFTLEGQCCEDPVNYPDYPCFPHQLCGVWELPETTIGPIDFILEPFDNSSGIGDDCAWRGTSCHAIPISACTICDCPPQSGTLWVCVRLELFCAGIQTANLSVHYSYGEQCECNIGTTGAQWAATYNRTSNPSCDPYCPEDFECNEEWDQSGYGGDPGLAWGGGTLNCNRFAGPNTLPPLATIDYGTLLWTLGC